MNENVTKKRPRREELSERTVGGIMKHHQQDIELYNYALNIFETQIREMGDSFGREVETLKILNNLYSTGMFHFIKGDNDSAIDVFKSALDLEPNSTELNNIVGVLHYKKGEPVLALQHFLKCMKINPFDADPIVNCANVLSQMGKHEEADYYYSILKKVS